MQYAHVAFVLTTPETEEEIEYENDRRAPRSDFDYGIHATFTCARIDCDNQEVIAADNEDIARPTSGNDQVLVLRMPEGWGYDRHGGPDASLHCPHHRQAPTKAEIAAINASLEGTELTADKSGDTGQPTEEEIAKARAKLDSGPIKKRHTDEAPLYDRLAESD